MTTRLLIDGIMRQTTVLIAELSTNAGLRAPLAHVADQVFVDLAREIEAQGVSQKVVADMFGLALRTYSARVNKLTESKSSTVRDAIVRFLTTSDTQSATWSSIESALVPKADAGPQRRATLRSVLKDLVGSGLVYKTGRGDETIYGLVDREICPN